jgi:predicted enzyme related to lactoylglutathione lyase
MVNVSKGDRHMPSDQKVDYLEFPAKDFDTIQSFYEKAFGWSFTD